jgi:serine/threonine-protein kinase
MATVYRALDTTLNRPVAVKVLHPHLCRDAAFVERFLDMERRVARLWHPHLVTILDASAQSDATDGAACFVVMEDVDGGSLRQRLAAGAPLPTAEVVRLTAEVAGALQHLHEQGIVHGDVKPENILITDRGQAKLIDFGIAHCITPPPEGETDEEITVRLDALHGTTAYLAPEQIEGAPPDARSDVYALGLVAYEMLAGRRPFESDHWVAAATQRLVREPEALSALRPDLPPHLAAAVATALARDPAARFPTARDFGETLTAALSQAPTARPAPRATDPDATTALLGPAPLAVTVPGPRTAAARVDISRAASRLRELTGHLDRLDRRSRLALLAGVIFSALIVLIALPGLLNPPRPVRLASLAGKPLEEAQAAVTAAGARSRIVETASDTVPKGHVVRQEPPADAEFRSDRPTTLFVSSGPPPVRVPDLRDRRLEDARKDLEAAGLTLGKVQERETDRRPWGTVLGQGARGGGLLAPGTAVDVVVGSPPHTNAPAVTGRSLGEAEAELHKKGLVLGEVRQEASTGKRAGTVLSQEPAGGVRLRQGEAVVVTIAVPPRAG